FEREALVYRTVHSTHLPSLFDVGKLEDGRPYLIMKLYDAPSAADLLAIEPFSIYEALEVAAQLLDVVIEIHACGIVHRDIKPSNILLTEDQDHRLLIKLVDYGISDSCNFPPHLRLRSLLVGTPPYMAPEQFSGEELDHRCDVYSVGAVLYELLTGRPP